MKYLWRLAFVKKGQSFLYTELPPEMEKKLLAQSRTLNPSIQFEKAYLSNTANVTSPEDESIRSIIEASKKLHKKLDCNLDPDFFSIERGLHSLVVNSFGSLFEVKLRNKEIQLRTENNYSFTKEEFVAIFDFIGVLVDLGWFY